MPQPKQKQHILPSPTFFVLFKPFAECMKPAHLGEEIFTQPTDSSANLFWNPHRQTQEYCFTSSLGVPELSQGDKVMHKMNRRTL